MVRIIRDFYLLCTTLTHDGQFFHAFKFEYVAGNAAIPDVSLIWREKKVADIFGNFGIFSGILLRFRKK